MKVAIDTNVLLRAVLPLTDDSVDARQSAIAGQLLRETDVVVVPLPVLCEFAWVLASGYRFQAADIARAVRSLISASNVACDRQVIDVGLKIADRGGDFADGVIAEAGLHAGADHFASFDRKAVRLLSTLGRRTELLA